MNDNYHFLQHASAGTMAAYISVQDKRHWDCIGMGATEEEAAHKLIECKRAHGALEGDEGDMFDPAKRPATFPWVHKPE